MTNSAVKTDAVILFEKGMNNCENYRIPSIIRTKKGTLIVAVDARVDKPGDNPNNIDKVIRRSVDNGDTWQDIQVIVDYPGYSSDGAAACDASMLFDEQTNTIWMLYNHTPGGIGLVKSEQYIGFDENANKILFDENNNEYVLHSSGEVFLNGEKSKYFVEKNGNVIRKGMIRGNIYLNSGELLERKTSFLQAVKSDDEGLTWSDPIDLNPFVKESWMKFIGACPGNGIQLKSDKYNGRLIFPIYYNNATEQARMSCCVIYSDDHGFTWKCGKSPNDNRTINETVIHSKTLTKEEHQLTESQVIEHKDGSLEIFMRNHEEKRYILRATSINGGESWSNPYFDETLVQPICQCSVISYPNSAEENEIIIFSNSAHKTQRINGTVRLSEDAGKTWKYSKMLQEGSYVYSSLVALANNEVGLFYEVEYEEPQSDIKMYFTKFNLEWLK